MTSAQNTSPLKKIQQPNFNTENRGKTTKEKVANTLTEEIIIGICSPIGSLKEPVIKAIEKILEEKYNYQVESIKLSDFIGEYMPIKYQTEPGKTEPFTKFHNKIKGGNQIRLKYQNYSILADLAITKIYNDRIKQIMKNGELPDFTDLRSRRVCYIINSIKNKDELLTLRAVYKELFYLFGIYSPLVERHKNLQKSGMSEPESTELINKDEYEANIKHGQNVRETFVESDFFFRVSKQNENDVEEKVKRYLHLIFGSEIITPNKDERAMYFAKSAALNSACLSRQVGAAITDKDGNLLSQGWNDVPKYGGNLYEDDEATSCKCKDLNKCSNDEYKDNITSEIFNILNQGNYIKKGKEESLREEMKLLIRKNTRVKDLIEFSRSVHAEMHAIIIGSQNTGSKMVNGKLYCTTYPCHNCARHIIVAGIKKVFFIEPYVKSLCIELHSDAISEDESEKNEDKVKILLFDGIAPRRYLEFFNLSEERKLNGKLKSQKLSLQKPKTKLTLQALSTLEQQAVHQLSECGLIINHEKTTKG